MKTNKEILKEYLEYCIRVDELLAVISEVSAKGRSTDKYVSTLNQYIKELERYVSSYPWILEVFKVKELE
jgi:hypothetical protein